ncbi:hypothetical protein [Helicobacter pullorum]|uniref:hypothetical protein n=1 Tax=Helicobacter pullorum TaxID=35818 RepID=UPI001064889D|nr:hypothetical protein [Helicobacter pullorum]
MDFNPSIIASLLWSVGLSCGGCAFVSRLRYLGLKTKEPFCIFDVDYTENKSDIAKLPFEEYKRYLLT